MVRCFGTKRHHTASVEAGSVDAEAALRLLAKLHFAPTSYSTCCWLLPFFFFFILFFTLPLDTKLLLLLFFHHFTGVFGNLRLLEIPKSTLNFKGSLLS